PQYGYPQPGYGQQPVYIERQRRGGGCGNCWNCCGLGVLLAFLCGCCMGECCEDCYNNPC
uniref:Cysteine-rich transmembrane CYSTM domain-containing protein n=1 Tax=Acrobeloides nanus TaxID=290746 RepID=A0A914CXD1_9BILA